jgi:hypothetical protein
VLDRVLAAYDAGVDELDRAQAALALMWATGPGAADPEDLVDRIEQALRDVAGRHHELELRLESCRQLFKTNRLDRHRATRTVAIALAEARRRG